MTCSAKDHPGPALRFYLVTIFPEIFDSFLRTSLVGRALETGLLDVVRVDPRDFCTDEHRSVDDAPFGGGEGMVMKPGPLLFAMESVPGRPHRILLTPQGALLTQPRLLQIKELREVMLVCGRYEGFDERIRAFVDEEISLGDFVLGGGEVAAMALMEAVGRLVPGVMGNAGSLATESHIDGLLEHPQYTRPREFRGLQVPEVLLGGNHEQIRRWRRMMMLARTRQRRPDLWSRCQDRLTAEDLQLAGEQEEAMTSPASRTYLALLHHPVLDRSGKVVTTAVTNLDLHDIARSCRTYGLAGYFMVTPLTSQQELICRILGHWRGGHGSRVHKERREALDLVRVAGSLSEVLGEIEKRHGQPAVTVATSAVHRTGQLSPAQVLSRAGTSSPLLLLFGTGWGLVEEQIAAADLAVAPIEGTGGYNHLSVRSAAAILLDRFFSMSQ